MEPEEVLLRAASLPLAICLSLWVIAGPLQGAGLLFRSRPARDGRGSGRRCPAAKAIRLRLDALFLAVLVGAGLLALLAVRAALLDDMPA